MARIETDPNYTNPTFSRATAPTDPFKKEDVQALAAAMSTHDHSTGKGVAVPFATAIPNGTITSAMIADGTIDTADLKDGAVTSAKIADGTIATADHADASVTNIKLASDTARQNLLTNGGFEIWQRGNGPFTANGVWAADRWVVSLNGTDTLSMSRDTSNVDVGSGACAACAFTKGSGTTTNIQQSLRPSDFPQLKGRILSVSVRVRTNVANVAVVRIASDGTNAITNESARHSGSGQYETLTVTSSVAVPNDATVILIYVFMQNTSATVYVDNAMLVVGSVPADYAPLHPADDLARCYRYYERIGEYGDLAFGGTCIATLTGAVIFYIPYKTRKAVSPTITIVGSSWGNANCSPAVPSVNASHVDAVRLQVATVAGNANFWMVSGALTYVTVEANP